MRVAVPSEGTASPAHRPQGAVPGARTGQGQLRGTRRHSPPHRQFLIQRCSHCLTAVVLLGDLSMVRQPHLQAERRAAGAPRREAAPGASSLPHPVWLSGVTLPEQRHEGGAQSQLKHCLAERAWDSAWGWATLCSRTRVTGSYEAAWSHTRQCTELGHPGPPEVTRSGVGLCSPWGGGSRPGSAHLVQALHSSVGWAPRCSLRRWSILGWPGALEDGGSGGGQGPAHGPMPMHLCHTPTDVLTRTHAQMGTHTCRHGAISKTKHVRRTQSSRQRACGCAPTPPEGAGPP